MSFMIPQAVGGGSFAAPPISGDNVIIQNTGGENLHVLISKLDGRGVEAGWPDRNRGMVLKPGERELFVALRVEADTRLYLRTASEGKETEAMLYWHGFGAPVVEGPIDQPEQAL